MRTHVDCNNVIITFNVAQTSQITIKLNIRPFSLNLLHFFLVVDAVAQKHDSRVAGSPLYILPSCNVEISY